MHHPHAQIFGHALRAPDQSRAGTTGDADVPILLSPRPTIRTVRSKFTAVPSVGACARLKINDAFGVALDAGMRSGAAVLTSPVARKRARVQAHRLAAVARAPLGQRQQRLRHRRRARRACPYGGKVQVAPRPRHRACEDLRRRAQLKAQCGATRLGLGVRGLQAAREAVAPLGALARRRRAGGALVRGAAARARRERASRGRAAAHARRLDVGRQAACVGCALVDGTARRHHDARGAVKVGATVDGQKELWRRGRQGRRGRRRRRRGHIGALKQQNQKNTDYRAAHARSERGAAAAAAARRSGARRGRAPHNCDDPSWDGRLARKRREWRGLNYAQHVELRRTTLHARLTYTAPRLALSMPAFMRHGRARARGRGRARGPAPARRPSWKSTWPCCKRGC